MIFELDRFFIFLSDRFLRSLEKTDLFDPPTKSMLIRQIRSINSSFISIKDRSQIFKTAYPYLKLNIVQPIMINIFQHNNLLIKHLVKSIFLSFTIGFIYLPLRRIDLVRSIFSFLRICHLFDLWVGSIFLSLRRIEFFTFRSDRTLKSLDKNDPFDF